MPQLGTGGAALPRFEVVLPTRNRPHLLRHALASLAGGDHPPERIHVVDAVDAGRPARQVERELSRTLRERIHWHVATPGTAAQRNHGLRACSEELILFTDDDVLWERSATALMSAVLRDDVSRSLGAVCACESRSASASTALRSFARRLVFRLGEDPLTKLGRAHALRLAGHLPPPPGGCTPVPWIRGHRIFARRSCLPSRGFDEGLGRFALFEDVDLSLHVATKRWIVGVHGARMAHKAAAGHRASQEFLGLANVLNRARIVARHAEPGAEVVDATRLYLQRLAEAYGRLGRLAARFEARARAARSALPWALEILAHPGQESPMLHREAWESLLSSSSVERARRGS